MLDTYLKTYIHTDPPTKRVLEELSLLKSIGIDNLSIARFSPLGTVL